MVEKITKCRISISVPRVCDIKASGIIGVVGAVLITALVLGSVSNLSLTIHYVLGFP